MIRTEFLSDLLPLLILFIPVKTKVNVTARVKISEFKKKDIALITWNQAMRTLKYSD